MTFKLYAMDGEHDMLLLEDNDLSVVRNEYDRVISSFKDGSHDFDLEDLEDGMTVVIEDSNQVSVVEETFYQEADS